MRKAEAIIYFNNKVAYLKQTNNIPLYLKFKVRIVSQRFENNFFLINISKNSSKISSSLLPIKFEYFFFPIRIHIENYFIEMKILNTIP